jgi:tight adherence protein C
MNPVSIGSEAWLLVGALAIAGLSGLYLVQITKHEEIPRVRLETLRAASTVPQQTRRSWYWRPASLLATNRIIVGRREQERLLGLLASAGVKARGSLATFIVSKVGTAVVSVGLVWVLNQWLQLSDSTVIQVGLIGGALLLGWRLPDLALSQLAKQRRYRLEMGIPDALDLLVICAEAGLSLNQSIEEVSREMEFSNTDVAEEFATTAAELRISSDFGQAFDNFAERTGLPELGRLIAILKQSLKFGTSLADSMRMLASEMRVTRYARIEERAARLPVLLSIPMMLFILPCLLIIIGTPVVLRAMDAFSSFSFGAV